MKFDFTARCAQGLTIEANEPEKVVMRVLDAIHKAAQIGRNKAHVLVPMQTVHDIGVALAEAGYGVEECSFTTTRNETGMIVKW